MSGALSGQVALVTGASRGIGRAIAKGLARAGADVVGVGRDTVALKELGEEVTDLGRGFTAIRGDLSEPNGIEEMVAEAWSWHGRVDTLVNAAGVMVRRSELEVTPEDWDQVFAINVRGTFFLTQAVGARMLSGSGGVVVNVASVAGEVTTGASAPYSASKAAVVQLTRVLAVRWAPAVRVNAVGPAYVRTDLNASWLEVPANRNFVVSRTPMGRVGEPEDVVGAVVFLSSPAASYVTGQHLLVDGGWTAQ
ncbi:MAG: SDR family NAD(P)-dependent oxidoreductase [Acidimicrobiales bacterium]